MSAPMTDDDELPPCDGERLRDTTARMLHRALYEDADE